MLLRTKIAELNKEAVSADGFITEQQLSAYERLDRLVKLNKSLTKSKTKQSILLVCLVALTLLSASFLLFGHIEKTNIEMDLEVSDFAVRFEKDWSMFSRPLSFEELSITGFTHIDVPVADQPEHNRIRSSVATVRGFIPDSTAGSLPDYTPGRISFELNVPGGAEVGLSVTEDEGQSPVRLSLLDLHSDIQLSTYGAVEIQADGNTLKEVYSYPRAIQFSAGKNEFGLTFQPDSHVEAINVIPIDSLSVRRINRYWSDDLPAARLESTILGGTLLYADLENKEYNLRRGENLVFDRLSGIIRSVEQTERNSFVVRISATVEGMSSGGPNLINMMPTYLEWLESQRSIWLLWGSVIYVVGLLISIIRFFQPVTMK